MSNQHAPNRTTSRKCGISLSLSSICLLTGAATIAWTQVAQAIPISPVVKRSEVVKSGAGQLKLHRTDRLKVRGHLQAGTNAIGEKNLFWDLARRAAGNDTFDADSGWLESFVEPGVSFRYELDSGSSWFGKVSAVASNTSGTDAFDAGDEGRITLEEAYIGYKAQLAGDTTLQGSIGPRPLKLGTGMLIFNGGADGFERGTLKFGPRDAWEMNAMTRLDHGPFQAIAFYIDANELASSDSSNRMAGLDLRWDGERKTYAGLTYINVVESEAPYPQAALGGFGPPNIIAGGREGLQSVNFYGRSRPFEGTLDTLAIWLDAAYQWNDSPDMQAWGGRIVGEYTFNDAPWKPSLAYHYQAFSGDDPKTSKLERFDPLYYNGSPSGWATGSKSAMVFINSNVQSHNLTLRVNPSPKDIVTLRYAHVRAHELLSPVQFGQATRLQFSDGISTVASGVVDAHLSDDFFIEYTHIVTPNLFLTGGFSISIPGAGIKEAAGGSAPNWTGAFFNAVLNY
ncbi:alginate export family protein [Sulfuriroseicoccus oceanibius]|uniref:Alginate export domain-containing protein n=1 Tax=Sulfuriroseicoccus oceanibius TaxID=2707525 RepID=A0A7T7F1V4_9BACT|nr:alginate export family protein [Sulfuriroseicoccus oceanibius]QQL45213.1 hypothetical protein G3M56_001095 [Sulfuriroseicoccus oceanibius]